MMDAMSVVTQLRDLASEPQNREAIAKDEGCLPGLVLFLDHKNPQVLFATLQTLRYLAELSQNIISMKNELGMMVSLEMLIEKSELSNDITDLAREVYEILSTPERTETFRTPEQPMRRNKPQFFINNSNKKAKTVTLHIQGLEGTDQRGVCEDALLKVKGVISFTFQMAMRRCTVRVRADLPTESLASAIAATKVLSAQQVVKDESGEEVLIPLNTSDTHIEQNPYLPDYLPEDESPEKETGRAVSRTAAKQDASGSWLSSAASFLTKTFYWKPPEEEEKLIDTKNSNFRLEMWNEKLNECRFCRYVCSRNYVTFQENENQEEAREEKKAKMKRKYRKYKKNVRKALRYSWKCLLLGLQTAGYYAPNITATFAHEFSNSSDKKNPYH